jgi:hypothetical protein
MTKVFRKQWPLLLLVTISLLIGILNSRIKYTIMGLDNASPYFDPVIILNRIKGTSTVIYGGILFQTPFLFVTKILRISPEITSNLYVFGNLILGILGTFFLIKKSTKKNTSAVIGTLLLISSMLTFWIFSQPNFLFIASYGSIPFLLFLLGKEKKRYYD